MATESGIPTWLVVALVVFPVVLIATDGLFGAAAVVGPALALASVAAIPLLVVAIRRAGGSSAPMVTLTWMDDELLVEPNGVYARYALRRRVVIPFRDVTTVTVTGASTVPVGLRSPGTALTGLLRAGSYGAGSRRTFWLIRRGETVLVVDLAAGGDYRRVVLELEDPDGVAERLVRAVGER